MRLVSGIKIIEGAKRKNAIWVWARTSGLGFPKEELGFPTEKLGIPKEKLGFPKEEL